MSAGDLVALNDLARLRERVEEGVHRHGDTHFAVPTATLLDLLDDHERLIEENGQLSDNVDHGYSCGDPDCGC